MLALALTIAAFVFFALVGAAVLAIARPPGDGLQKLLLAPAVGIAAVDIPVLLLNRAGWPVGSFSTGLIIALALLSAGALLRWGREFPCTRFGPFAALLLVALLLTGRPLLEFGFDWASHCNGDMGNYCLRATRLAHHGFDDLPTRAELLEGIDRTQIWWAFDVISKVRIGCDLLLALCMGATGLSAHQAYMPLILAFHLALISAAAGLTLEADGRRRAALWVGALVAVSPLTTLGTLYQLLGQVSGIGLLCAAAAFFLRPLGTLSRGELVRLGAVAGLMAAALLVVYPETVPFVGLAFLSFHALQAWRGCSPPRSAAGLLGVAGTVVLLLLQTSAIGTLLFLLDQVRASKGYVQSSITLFPYFLVPSGLATLWGLVPYGYGLPPEPWLSLSIAAGAALLLGSAAASAWQAWRGRPAAHIALVMLALAASLYRSHNGFGLFKLAMYSQPFLLPALAFSLLSTRRRLWGQLGLASLMAIGLVAQHRDVDASRGYVTALVEVNGASPRRITADFRRQVQELQPERVVLDSYNFTLVKFQELYTRGMRTAAPALPWSISRGFNYRGDLPPVYASLGPVHREMKAQLVERKFPLLDAAGRENGFVEVTTGREAQVVPERDYVALSGPLMSLVNRSRFHSEWEAGRSFLFQSVAELRDALIFLPSQLGQVYFGVDARNPSVALYHIEKDVQFDGSTMAGVGRHLLFEVLNPSAAPRLVLDVSATLKADGENRLPPVEAIGMTRQRFPTVGRGAARVVSPPLQPRWINGRAYIALDLGCDGTGWVKPRTGLMGWYGREVSIDPKQIVVFARDISLISDADYAALAPPSAITGAAQDLQNPALEFSGIYEDRWLSDEVCFHLTQPDDASCVVLEAQTPLIDDPGFRTEATLLVDGREVARRNVGPGTFTLRAPSLAAKGRRRVELRWSHAQPLPGGDHRRVTARLMRLGFEADESARQESVAEAEVIRGATTDGWMTREGLTVRMSRRQLATQSQLTLRGVWPGAWERSSPAVRAELLLADGRQEPVSANLAAAQGEYELTIRFEPRAATESALLRVTFDRGFVPQELGLGSDRRELVAKAPHTLAWQAAEMFGGTADGWVTRDGLTVRLPREVLSGGSELSLTGRWPARGLQQPPGVRAELYVPHEDSETITATLTLRGDRYDLRLSWPPREATADAEARIAFDADFAFHDLDPELPDRRRLVTRFPEEAAVVR